MHELVGTCPKTQNARSIDMLDFHDRSRTETWSQVPTVLAGAWPAFPTTAATTEPEYAWSAEPAQVPEYSAPGGRWSRLARPIGFIAGGAGAAAVVAAALAIVFSGPSASTAVATPNASTTIAPAPAPASAAPAAQPATALRPKGHHATPSTAAPVSHTARPAPVEPSENQNWSQTEEPSNQWSHQWHDTTPRHSNWNFFRPDFDTSQRHGGGADIQRFFGHHDPSSDGNQ
jgi:hypothetical protein